MSTVVSLRHHRARSVEPAIPALVDLLANRRRHRHDPFWLKENAELAQILAATGASVTLQDLAPWQPVVSTLLDELQFFPQYYRLYLSLAVDLAALGVPDVPLDQVTAFIQRERLAEIELSDMQRAEARLLMRRAGAEVPDDAGLQDRLDAFARNSHAFCLPNRRAAYDLTHIVFHAADYGRVRLDADPGRRQSLIHAGMVAWLEDNLDLLAEVVIALALSGEEAPELWARAICRGACEVEFSPGHEGARFDDDYHQYLVANWAASVIGGESFLQGVPQTARLIRQNRPAGPALREVSMALLDLGAARSGDWARMRWRLWGRLSETSRTRIEGIEGLPEFESFFAGFARAGHEGGKMAC